MNLSGSTIYGEKIFSGNMVTGGIVSGPTNVGFELILSLNKAITNIKWLFRYSTGSLEPLRHG